MRKQIFLFVLLLGLMSLKPLNKVDATSEFSIEVKPSVIAIQSSKESHVPITIKNLTDHALQLNPEFYGIKDAGQRNGTVEMSKLNSSDKENLSKTISLRENDQSLSSMEIQPLESRQISLDYQPIGSIDNAFFTLVFSSVEETDLPEDVTSSSLVPGVGILVLISSDKLATSHPQIYPENTIRKSGPLTFHASVENKSDSLQVIKPQISIKNALKQTVATIKLDTQYLLPHSKRDLLVDGNNPSWNDSFLLGPYEATLVVNNRNAIEQVSTHIYILPIFPILFISFLIFFSLGVYLRMRR